MVTRVFQLLLLLSPIAVGANVDMDYFDFVFFRTGIAALFGASLMDTPKRAIPESIRKIIFYLIVICIVNLFLTTFAPIVLKTTLNLFLGIFGFCIVYTYLDTSKDLKSFILWAALFNLLFWLGQKVGFNPAYNKMPYLGQEGGFLGNQPRLLTYFALVTPFLWTPLLIISVILGIYSGQFVILAPVAIVLLYRSSVRERILLIIALSLGVVLLWGHIYSSLVYRFNVSWYPALKAFFIRPLLGYGLGNIFISQTEPVFNDYLQFILGVGVIGAVWFGYAFKTICKSIKIDNDSIALVSLALIMLFEYPLELTRLNYLIIAIISMALIKGLHSENIQADKAD